MKFKPPISDHEKDALVAAKSKKYCAEIMEAFRMGKTDKANKLKDLNPYSKSKQTDKYIAYENGYKGK